MSVRMVLKQKGEQALTIGPDRELGAAVALLLERRIGCLPVVDASGELVGLLSERDVAEAVHRSPLGVRHLRVEQVMRHPAPSCGIDAGLTEVMMRMTRERLRHLMVVDGKRLAGVLSVGDLVKHRLEQLETEAGVLRDYVAAQRASR